MPLLNGQEVVAASTEKAGRTLLISSFSILIITLGDLSTADLNIFGLSLPENVFKVSSIILILYFIALLSFRWYLDFLSYQSWVDNNDIGEPFRGMSIGEHIGAGASQIRSVLGKVENYDQDVASSDLQDIKRILNDLETNFESYIKIFDSVGKDLKKLSFAAKVYLYGIALVIPISSGLVSLVALTNL